MLQCVAVAKKCPRPYRAGHDVQMIRSLLGILAANSLHDWGNETRSPLKVIARISRLKQLAVFSLGGQVIFVPCFLKCSLLFLKETLFPAGIGISRSPMGKLNFVEFVIIQIHPKTLFEIWLNA